MVKKGSAVASLFLVAVMAAGFLLILNNVSSFGFTTQGEVSFTANYPYDSNWSANGSYYNLKDVDGTLYINQSTERGIYWSDPITKDNETLKVTVVDYD